MKKYAKNDKKTEIKIKKIFWIRKKVKKINQKMGLPINDPIPRVPEPHAEISVEDEKLYSDLYIRTSWFDAALALDQIEKVSSLKMLNLKF